MSRTAEPSGRAGSAAQTEGVAAAHDLPVVRRVRDDLLAWHEPRPPVDLDLAPQLRADLLEGTAPAAAAVPEGQTLWLAKSALDALACDGRYLDSRAQVFTWSAATLRGQLAHHAIEIDFAGRRNTEPHEIIDAAWDRIRRGPGGAAAFLDGLTGAQADDLRGQSRALLTAFREQFPLLPDRVVHPEDPLRVRLHDGRVVLSGRPDLRLGGPRTDDRRIILLDLKTGTRYPDRHRADLRFYALLATLKHGIAPFRLVTYYLDEADWDAEDVEADLLAETVASVATKAVRAATLAFTPPAEDELSLVGGPQCRWCSRAPTCPAAVAGP